MGDLSSHSFNQNPSYNWDCKNSGQGLFPIAVVTNYDERKGFKQDRFIVL